MAKKIFKSLGILLLIILVIVIGLIAFLSITEFKPGEAGSVENLEITGESTKTLKSGDSINLMTWNIGYGALGDNADFFMDGGKSVYTADSKRINYNLVGMLVEIKANDPDILLTQEVDLDSARSRHINEYEMLQFELPDYNTSFANNFKVAFLPYPLPPIGKVVSGISTFSKYPVESAERIQLPIPFKWPVSMANLKRCIIESRIPVEGTDKELVVMNLHLEAYDSGEGKIAQTKALAERMKIEQDKGNYVIVGGDFNQIFSTADASRHPIKPGLWQAGEIDVDSIQGNWQFLMDEIIPSCRSLDQPYIGTTNHDFQYYLIDGFIVSDNIEVKSMHAVETDFVYSDHNPVLAEVVLK